MNALVLSEPTNTIHFSQNFQLSKLNLISELTRPPSASPTTTTRTTLSTHSLASDAIPLDLSIESVMPLPFPTEPALLPLPSAAHLGSDYVVLCMPRGDFDSGLLSDFAVGGGDGGTVLRSSDNARSTRSVQITKSQLAKAIKIAQEKQRKTT